MLPDSGKVDRERAVGQHRHAHCKGVRSGSVPFLELPREVTVGSLCSVSGGRELAVTTTACMTMWFL